MDTHVFLVELRRLGDALTMLEKQSLLFRLCFLLGHQVCVICLQAANFTSTRCQVTLFGPPELSAHRADFEPVLVDSIQGLAYRTHNSFFVVSGRSFLVGTVLSE